MEWEDASLRQLMDELPDLVCRFSPDGTLLYANRAYAEFHNTEPAAMLGRSFLDFVDSSARVNIQAALKAMQHITVDNPVRQNTHQTLSGTGEARWHEWTDRAFFTDEGKLLGFMSIGRDLTEILTVTKAAEHELLHDHLTGVLNRRGLFAMLGNRLVHADRPFLVGYVDIDHFKGVNDKHGHREGDRVLVQVSDLLEKLTPDVTTGRIGGDEFVLVVPGADSMDQGPSLSNELDRLLGSISPPVSASCGWAVATPGDTTDDVLHAADKDMYRRKDDRGKGDDDAMVPQQRHRETFE